jgi:hypothetical protein
MPVQARHPQANDSEASEHTAPISWRPAASWHQWQVSCGENRKRAAAPTWSSTTVLTGRRPESCWPHRTECGVLTTRRSASGRSHGSRTRRAAGRTRPDWRWCTASQYARVNTRPGGRLTPPPNRADRRLRRQVEPPGPCQEPRDRADVARVRPARPRSSRARLDAPADRTDERRRQRPASQPQPDQPARSPA